MEYLPAEIQLKIFKNLNFDELFSIKQTNRYFYNFIDKYKDELARKKFDRLSFMYREYKKLKIKSIDFSSSDHLQEKWEYAMDKQIQIPIYLDFESMITTGTNSPYENQVLHFYPEVCSQEKDAFTLKLPLYPKNIEELKIVRYWLEQIGRCDFGYLEFNNFIFNPEMIKMLFDNDEIAKFKFNCEEVRLCFLYINIDVWNFTFEHLVVSGSLRIAFSHGRIVFPYRDKQKIEVEGNNYLLKLLLNVGDRINRIVFQCEMNQNQIPLYNNIIDYIETSTDLSKMVANIEFSLSLDWPCSKLTARGVEMSENNDSKKCYKITNIHNPKMKILIEWYFDTFKRDIIEYISIICSVNSQKY